MVIKEKVWNGGKISMVHESSMVVAKLDYDMISIGKVSC